MMTPSINQSFNAEGNLWPDSEDGVLYKKEGLESSGGTFLRNIDSANYTGPGKDKPKRFSIKAEALLDAYQIRLQNKL